jgi:hypothetical protein
MVSVRKSSRQHTHHLFWESGVFSHFIFIFPEQHSIFFGSCRFVTVGCAVIRGFVAFLFPGNPGFSRIFILSREKGALRLCAVA